MPETVVIPRKSRHFLPENFIVDKWETILPYYTQLLEWSIDNVDDLKEWFASRSELEAVLAEDAGWRYIRMTCDTTNEEYRQQFNFFISEIEPHIAPLTQRLNEIALESPYLEMLPEAGYAIMIRRLKSDVAIFRTENIPLHTKIQQEAQQYGAINGAMTVTIDGQEITLQQAADKLQSTAEAVRSNAYKAISQRRLEDKDRLDKLFTDLITLRNQIALNAGFQNYRDYMFAAMGRFDYSPADCRQFHEAVATEVVPLMNEQVKQRKALLGLKTLKPWDKNVDTQGREPLKPFENSQDLIDKTIECFSKLDPFLGQCLSTMKKMGHLDLESRKGKSPGGYNYPLAETGVPFIFMNATSNLRDMITMLHEGGHAVHSFLMRDLELNDFKNPPSEVAELASMAMELISLDFWHLYFEDEDELQRAKKEHLGQIIETLPWVATIDQFQHWIYENPNHTIEERNAEWLSVFEKFSDDITDWSGLATEKAYVWHKQLHLFEVPFYYIEYGMAQLGAIAVWKNFKEDPDKGLQGYKDALSLGYTCSIPEIYEAAGIKFDFSQSYIKELMAFVKEEMNKL